MITTRAIHHATASGLLTSTACYLAALHLTGGLGGVKATLYHHTAAAGPVLAVLAAKEGETASFTPAAFPPVTALYAELTGAGDLLVYTA
jgi:hypothetical protein